LILTSECNLRCAYCFENSKGPGRMEWGTLKAALDLALKHGQHRMKILFSGGEPLLEFELIRKALAYTKGRIPRSKHLSFTLITNGTLLTNERAAFLARRSVNVQVSSDGVSAAQERRAPDTFASLDELLDRLRRDLPDFYENHVRISMTVVPRTVRYLADSFGYFLTKGVRRVAVAPSISDDTSWKLHQKTQLQRQFGRIYEMSLAHFDRTGDVPFVLFRPLGEETRSSDGDLPLSSDREGEPEVSRIRGQLVCAAGRGEMLAVDVDRRVYPCITLAASCQTLESAVLKESARAMRLGSLSGSQFWERYHRLPQAAGRLAIFKQRESRRSSYRLCKDCRYLSQCLICPVSLGHLPGNESCERVPDFACAFTFTGLKYREQFLKQISLPRKFRRLTSSSPTERSQRGRAPVTRSLAPEVRHSGKRPQH